MIYNWLVTSKKTSGFDLYLSCVPIKRSFRGYSCPWMKVTIYQKEDVHAVHAESCQEKHKTSMDTLEIPFNHHSISISHTYLFGWWYTYHSEKYFQVSWDYSQSFWRNKNMFQSPPPSHSIAIKSGWWFQIPFQKYHIVNWNDYSQYMEK